MLPPNRKHKASIWEANCSAPVQVHRATFDATRPRQSLLALPCAHEHDFENLNRGKGPRPRQVAVEQGFWSPSSEIPCPNRGEAVPHWLFQRSAECGVSGVPQTYTHGQSNSQDMHRSPRLQHGFGRADRKKIQSIPSITKQHPHAQIISPIYWAFPALH